MSSRPEEFPLGRKLTLPGHFAVPVVLEAVRKLGEGYECRVRLPDGTPDEAILSPAEAKVIFGKPEPTYRKVTFHKERLDEDQHIDAVLTGPGQPLYAAVDERLNELLADVVGGVAVFSDPQTGYRDPVEGIRRIEVKGRTRGYSIRLTTNEWYKATQLGDTYWLYVVWDPLGTNPELVVIRNPAAKLDHAKREVVAARHYDILAEAIKQHGQPVA